jgi:hypothetical protein
MPAIEVSCPVCSTNNVVEMRIMEPKKDGLTDLLFGIVSDIGIKHYAFAGEGKCSKCGEGMDVSLNVANQRKGG